MAKDNQKDLLSTLKTVIIAGYAASLFIPYKVEKHDGETTYHAPLYKLSYKTNQIETTEKEADTDSEPCAKKQTVHTYTITSFGLLNDQIATAQRLYKAALLKKPSIEAKIRYAANKASEKAQSTARCVCKEAKKTANIIKHKLEVMKEPKYLIEDVTNRLDEFIEDIID